VEAICTVCDRPVPQPRGGYRLYHPECKALHDDMERLKKHLSQLRQGVHQVKLSPKQTAQLRYELFCLVSELPRLRDSRGRFASSGASTEYDREVSDRRQRRAQKAEKAEKEAKLRCKLAAQGEPPCTR
jgi:hypothetical protein